MGWMTHLAIVDENARADGAIRYASNEATLIGIREDGSQFTATKSFITRDQAEAAVLLLNQNY